MRGKFIPRAAAEREKLDWGGLAWLSRPQTTGAKDLVVIEVSLAPGGGHAFHRHPNQEEVIYVISGSIEQWLEKERRTLGPGDSIFIPADTVHASFNKSKADAKLIAILGPCVGDAGYELVDVSAEEPWKALLQT
jgi:quercetin dioxygenase-like cupin family protein